MGRSQTVAPATEPLSLGDAKLHLRVVSDDDDDLITALIQGAREYVETFLRRQLVTATWAMTLDEFPDSDGDITLPLPPLASVTSIAYVDGDGDDQTLDSANYTVHTNCEPGKITLAYGESWPSTRDQPDAVTVTFVAGYGAAAAVPAGIVAAIKLVLGDLYENREAAVLGTIRSDNPTVKNLLWTYRIAEAV